MTDSRSILKSLKDTGHRITQSRKLVVEALCGSKVPLAVLDILAQLKRRRSAVNKTTVYRELEFLNKEKIIREIDLLEGKKRYEVIHSAAHHHHAVCVKCQMIQCVEMENDLFELEQRLSDRHRFKVTSHSLEFFGLCKDCQ
jgi:Fur family transcriptional regulator, ferric uptake regulator